MTLEEKKERHNHFNTGDIISVFRYNDVREAIKKLQRMIYKCTSCPQCLREDKNYKCIYPEEVRQVIEEVFGEGLTK